MQLQRYEESYDQKEKRTENWLNTIDEGDNLLRYLHAVSYQLACLLDIDGQHHGKLPSSSSSSIKSHGKQSHKREKKARNDTTRTPVRLQKSSLKSSPEHTGLNHNDKAATKQPPHQQASRANKRRKRRNGGNSNEHGVSLETNNLDDTNESIERKQQQQQHLNQLQTHHLQANISIQGFSDAQSALDAQLSLNIGDDMTLTGDHGVSISPSATHLSPIDPSIAPFGNSCSNQLHPQIVVPQIPTSSSSNIYYRGINGSHNINHNNLVDSYHQIHDNHNNHQQHQHHHDFGGSSSHESIPIAVTTLNSDQDHQHGHHMHNQHHLQTSIVGVVGNQTSDSIHGNSMTSDCYQNINQQQQQQQHHHQQHEHQSHQHQHESHHGHHMLSADHHQIHSYHNQLDHQWLGPTSSTAATQSGANSATHHQHNHHHHQQQQHHHQLHQEPLDQVVVSPLSPTSGSHQSIDQVHFAPLYHHSYYSSHQSDQLDSFQHLTNDEFTPTNNANGGVGGPGGGGGGGGGGVGVTNPNGQANSPASLIHMGGASTKSSSDGQQQSMNADSNNQGNNYDQLHLHSQQLHDINSSYHDHGHHHHHDHHQHHHHHHHQLAHNHHHHQHHHVMPLVNGIEPSSVILQDINLASATWSSPEDLYSI